MEYNYVMIWNLLLDRGWSIEIIQYGKEPYYESYLYNGGPNIKIDHYIREENGKGLYEIIEDAYNVFSWL